MIFHSIHPQKKAFIFGLIFSILLTLPSCLKTRSSLKAEEADTASSDDHATSESKTNKKNYVGRIEFEEVKNELARVTGKLEEVEYNQREIKAGDLKDTQSKLEARVNELEKNQIIIMTELKELKDQFNATNNSATQSVKNKTKDKKTLAEEHLANANQEFENHNYKKAIVEFSKVQELNPKHPQLATILFKIAISFEKLGMKKEAEGFYSEIIEKYPKSTEAQKAKQKLKN